MKRLGNIIPAVFLAAMITAGMGTAAFAESYDYDGHCTFTGREMVEDFDSGKVADTVSNLQPGDDVTFTVEYKNAYEESTDWYMENSIVKTLERTEQAKKKVAGTGQAENGGYTYELVQYDRTGAKKVLFSNSKVGGDEGTVADLETGKELEGLEPSTNALDDWFYIDTLKKGESGTVVLHVAFDGETEVNDYMDTDGELNVRFAVELTSSGTRTVTKKAVKTGDQSGLLMWAAVGVVAGLLMLVLAFLSRKGDEQRAEGKGGRA